MSSLEFTLSERGATKKSLLTRRFDLAGGVLLFKFLDQAHRANDCARSADKKINKNAPPTFFKELKRQSGYYEERSYDREGIQHLPQGKCTKIKVHNHHLRSVFWLYFYSLIIKLIGGEIGILRDLALHFALNKYRPRVSRRSVSVW